MKLKILAILLCVSGATPAAPNAPVLRAGVVNDSGGPMHSSQDGAQASIYRSVLELLARQSGIRFEVDYYPVQRLQRLFELGRLDVEVGVHPSWRALSPVAGFYTRPLGVIEYRLCFAPGKEKRVASAADLKGWRIGTLQGQLYPLLQPSFDSGQIKRDDAGSEAELMGRLRQGRTQAVVLSQRQTQWWSALGSSPRCVPGDALGSTTVMLRLHPSRKQLLPQLDRAIAQLQESGKLQSAFHP